MKCTILIKENRTQLVLHPEGKHDSNVLDILEEMPNTHRFDLYDREGGFTMFGPVLHDAFGDSKPIGKDLMIVFDKPTDTPAQSGGSDE